MASLWNGHKNKQPESCELEITPSLQIFRDFREAQVYLGWKIRIHLPWSVKNTLTMVLATSQNSGVVWLISQIAKYNLSLSVFRKIVLTCGYCRFKSLAEESRSRLYS